MVGTQTRSIRLRGHPAGRSVGVTAGARSQQITPFRGPQKARSQRPRQPWARQARMCLLLRDDATMARIWKKPERIRAWRSRIEVRRCLARLWNLTSCQGLVSGKRRASLPMSTGPTPRTTWWKLLWSAEMHLLGHPEVPTRYMWTGQNAPTNPQLQHNSNRLTCRTMYGTMVSA